MIDPDDPLWPTQVAAVAALLMLGLTLGLAILNMWRYVYFMGML